jgi:hypothetical protein
MNLGTAPLQRQESLEERPPIGTVCTVQMYTTVSTGHLKRYSLLSQVFTPFLVAL